MSAKIIGIGLAIAAAVALIIALVIHAKQEPPGEPDEPVPPPEGTGRIQGYVLDAGSGQGIAYPSIDVDGERNTYGDIYGAFRTSYMDFGLHTVSVYAKDYALGDFQVDLGQSLLQQNFELYRIDDQGGFPSDIEVTEISIKPQTPLAGQEVSIYVNLLGPYPHEPYPRTVTGTITVDGQELTQTIEMMYRNPRMTFHYTPPGAGVYIVRAGTRSARFEVLADVPGFFYSPFGCVKCYPADSPPYWESRNGLIDSFRHAWTGWPVPIRLHRDCAIAPTYYGSGSTTSKDTSICCPYCHDCIHGPEHDYYGIGDALLRHIEEYHSYFPLMEPPAWVICKERLPTKRHWITVDGEGIGGLRLMAVGMGTHTVTYGYSEGTARTVLAEWEVTLGSGDRATVDWATKTVDIKSWADLCTGGGA